jgi:homoserine O-acetyltransferase
VDSDRLFLPQESHKMSTLIPGAEPTKILHSDFGHDGFLIEFDQLAPMVGKFVRKHVGV